MLKDDKRAEHAVVLVPAVRGGISQMSLFSPDCSVFTETSPEFVSIALAARMQRWK